MSKRRLSPTFAFFALWMASVPALGENPRRALPIIDIHTIGAGGGSGAGATDAPPGDGAERADWLGRA